MPAAQNLRNFDPCQLQRENNDNRRSRVERSHPADRPATVDRALFEEARRALRSAMDTAPPQQSLPPTATDSPRTTRGGEPAGDMDAKIAQLDSRSAALAQEAARLRGLRDAALTSDRPRPPPPSRQRTPPP